MLQISSVLQLFNDRDVSIAHMNEQSDLVIM